MSVPVREPSGGVREPPARGGGLRAGMVGVGLISEFHVAAVQAMPGVDLVGVHDIDAARAEERAAEWSTTAFPSLEALVAAGANVIHVLTPPVTHAQVALEAIGRGCHVLVEKPLAESPEDAKRIGEAATENGVVATVSHSLLFDPQVLAALEKVRGGAVGEVIGVDFFRSQESPPYAGGPLPPHMRQAGYPWRDVGIHCLYLLPELLGEIVDIDAEWRSLGGDRNLAFDEWRALVQCERGIGQFQLTWNGRPFESRIEIRGTQATLQLDLFARFRTRRVQTPLPKAAEVVVNAYAESLRPLGEVPLNVGRFLSKRIQPYQGVRNLVTDFYTRLEEGLPPRVTVEDAAILVHWVEKVARAAEAEHERSVARFQLSETCEFLVTGATGSLGSAIVERLLEGGRKVRAFVRQPPEEPVDGVEYALGNLGDPEAVGRAVRGAEVVIHAGAAMSGGWVEHECSTVVGTRNVIEACRECGTRQLVHVSSLSVVDWAGSEDGEPINETTPLEPRPGERGAYTRAKLQAELDVSTAAAEGLPCVILRPGVIFGGGVPLLGPAVARRAGERWMVLGSGRLTVPLVYIDDVVDAVLTAVDRELVGGEVIQIIDPERLTQEEILALADADGRRTVHIPRSAVFLVARLSEYPLAKLGRSSPVGLYRLRSALAQAEFESDRAVELLGWHPRVGVREGIRMSAA